ncbi:MAG: metallophosphoesterase [Rhodothermales bacterium]
MNRRRFFQTLAAGGVGSYLAPLQALAADELRLVILHTNDTHSRIDPFPMDGGRNAGMGGIARRSALVQRIRAAEPNLLLLDSGDIFQGTPYFNFFGGELEFKAMSAMGYDASTLGNHDFDNGVPGLVKMLPHATFPFVSANYIVDAGSPLAGHTKPHLIKQVGRIKVGLFGLGIDFDHLVIGALHEGVTYTDPIVAARQQVDVLRQQGCHLIVCLSHLGYRYREDRPSDMTLAAEVPGIDLILGGHTHTFLDQPVTTSHPDGRFTIVNQVGWAGIRLGRIDVVFNRDLQSSRWYGSAYEIDERLDPQSSWG